MAGSETTSSSIPVLMYLLTTYQGVQVILAVSNGWFRNNTLYTSVDNRLTAFADVQVNFCEAECEQRLVLLKRFYQFLTLLHCKHHNTEYTVLATVLKRVFLCRH